jgi:hypothetical protein
VTIEGEGRYILQNIDLVVVVVMMLINYGQSPKKEISNIITTSFVFIICLLFKGGRAEGFSRAPGSYIVSFAEACSE